MEYAVIRLSNRQYRVKEGDIIRSDRIHIKKVDTLLVVNDGELILGTPVVSDVGVDLEVIEEKKDKKIEVRRFRAKSRYRKKKGHRQEISILKVKSIGKGKGKIINNLGSAVNEKDEISEKVHREASKETKLQKTQKEAAGIEKFGLSTRSFNALIRSGIKTEDQFMKLRKRDLEGIKGLGKKSIEEILGKIKS